jgi:hypothetical protein
MSSGFFVEPVEGKTSKTPLVANRTDNKNNHAYDYRIVTGA